MKYYKGIPIAKCPHDREMTDAELNKAIADGMKMLIASGWKPGTEADEEWKGPQ